MLFISVLMKNQNNRDRKTDKILHKFIGFVQSILKNNEVLPLAKAKVKRK
jgi:hypothetical protein